MSRIYDGSLLGEDGKRILDQVERACGMHDNRLGRLRLQLTEAQKPEAIAAEVAGYFWPQLRRLPTSRHAVDLIISGCAAVNYLRDQEEPSGRDQEAIQRVQRGLCSIALSRYPESFKAIDLIAVLSWWDVTTPLQYLSEKPTGRYLARALDRALRIYLDEAALPPADARDKLGNLLPERARSQYTVRIFNEVGRRLHTILHPRPVHSAVSFSQPAIRLARLIAMYDTDPASYLRRPYGRNPPGRSDKPHWEWIRDHFEGIASGKYNVTDVLVRREALWYLLELGQCDPVATKLADAVAKRDPAIFSDVRHSFPEVRDWTPEPGNRPLRQPRFPDLVQHRGLTWNFSGSTIGPALLRHLPEGDRLPGSHWRGLTKQVALPTASLLREAMVSPMSGRVCRIADAFGAAGDSVTKTVVRALEVMLRDSAVLAEPILATRAVWTIGYLGVDTPTVLSTLAQVAGTHRHADVAARAALAIGFILRSSPQTPGRDSAVESLVGWLTEIEARLGRVPSNDPRKRLRQIPPKDYCVAEAALYSLAVLHDPEQGEFLGKMATTCATVMSAVTEHPQAPNVKGKAGHPVDPRGYVQNMLKLARWGVGLLDSPLALSHSRW